VALVGVISTETGQAVYSLGESANSIAAQIIPSTAFGGNDKPGVNNAHHGAKAEAQLLPAIR
jgi:hypothetical protein